MPLIYSGDRTAVQAPSPLPAKNATPILSLPVDGEAAAVASIYQELKALADNVDYLTHKAGILDQPNTWTGAQTHQANVELSGSTGDANPTRTFSGAITTRKLIDSYAGSACNVRIYITNSGGYEVVTNAVWNTSGINANKWTQDTGALPSMRYSYDTVGQRWRWESQGGAAWVDGLWQVIAYVTASALTAGTTGATAGGGVAVFPGQIYFESVDFASGVLNMNAPSIVRAMNVTSITKIGGQVGLYKVTLQGAAPSRLLVASLVLESANLAALQVEQTAPYAITTSTFHYRAYSLGAVPAFVDLNPNDNVHFACRAY